MSSVALRKQSAKPAKKADTAAPAVKLQRIVARVRSMALGGRQDVLVLVKNADEAIKNKEAESKKAAIVARKRIVGLASDLAKLADRVKDKDEDKRLRRQANLDGLAANMAGHARLVPRAG
jgi:hypothetical protein